jgi:hypothetical protein
VNGIARGGMGKKGYKLDRRFTDRRMIAEDYLHRINAGEMSPRPGRLIGTAGQEVGWIRVLRPHIPLPGWFGPQITSPGVPPPSRTWPPPHPEQPLPPPPDAG